MFDHDFALNLNSATAHVGIWVISLERRRASSVNSGLWPKSITRSRLSPSLWTTLSKSRTAPAYSLSSTTIFLHLELSFLAMISAVVSARLAGLDRIKSGFTSRFANRLPIFGASRLPRSFNGRSLSGKAVYSQLDFAWRTRNSVFIFLRSTHRERPRHRRAAEQRDELAAFHSITSSARSRIAVGSSSPIALAVFRLTTNSNLLGCSIGRSAGFVPVAIRST